MEYEKALQIVRDYQYLIGKEITEKSTVLKLTIDFIIIEPVGGIYNLDKFWLNPLSLKYSKMLSDKECIVNFVVDYFKNNNIGISIDSRILDRDYLVPPKT